MKLHTLIARPVGLVLICAMLTLPNGHIARAGMVSTDSFLVQHAQTHSRGRLMNLLQKEEVLKKLQEYGVSPGEAKNRLASLSDAEVEKLNTQIDQLPAGGDAVEALIGTALFVFLVLLITDILCVTKVFKFTRCAH